MIVLQTYSFQKKSSEPEKGHGKSSMSGTVTQAFTALSSSPSSMYAARIHRCRFSLSSYCTAHMKSIAAKAETRVNRGACVCGISLLRDGRHERLRHFLTQSLYAWSSSVARNKTITISHAYDLPERTILEAIRKPHAERK